jgi:hypothetical protein
MVKSFVRRKKPGNAICSPGPIGNGVRQLLFADHGRVCDGDVKARGKKEVAQNVLMFTIRRRIHDVCVA